MNPAQYDQSVLGTATGFSQRWQDKTAEGRFGRNEWHKTLWIFLAAVTGDAQLANKTHPRCCRPWTVISWLRPSAWGVWFPFWTGRTQAFANLLRNTCLITCNPYKTGPNTESCIQREKWCVIQRALTSGWILYRGSLRSTEQGLFTNPEPEF